MFLIRVIRVIRGQVIWVAAQGRVVLRLAPPGCGGANRDCRSYRLIGNRSSSSFSMFNAFMAFSEL